MIFQAHTGYHPISILIRLFSRGRFNHISIKLGEFIYEAHLKGGVMKTHERDWDDSTVVETKEVKITAVQRVAVRLWLNKQVGKKYDLWGIFAFISFFAKPRMGYWYCSEYATVALAKALDKKTLLEKQKISPETFWEILNLVV